MTLAVKHQIEEPVVIPLKAHTLTEVEAKAASCTESGLLHHWKCSVCKMTFTDAEGKNAAKDIVDYALGHNVTCYPEKLPTTKSAGMKAHFVCQNCGGIFLDKSCSERTTNDMLSIPRVEEDLDGTLSQTFYSSQRALYLGGSDLSQGGVGVVVNARTGERGVYLHMLLNHQYEHVAKDGNVVSFLRFYLTANNKQNSAYTGRGVGENDRDVKIEFSLNGMTGGDSLYLAQYQKTIKNPAGKKTPYTSVWEVFIPYEELAAANHGALRDAFENKNDVYSLKKGYKLYSSIVGCMFVNSDWKAETFTSTSTAGCDSKDDGWWNFWFVNGYGDWSRDQKMMELSEGGLIYSSPSGSSNGTYRPAAPSNGLTLDGEGKATGTTYYQEAKPEQSESVANSKYAIVETTLKYNGNVGFWSHRFGIMMTERKGIGMPSDPEKWDGVEPSISYPSMQMLANSWDLEIVREYAECVADDCLDAGADILLGPGVNIKRSPLCGRNFEYFSEDPYLAGVLAREYIAGLQSEGAGACVKHFCCNNGETNRLQQSSEVDERTLREIYYKPFEIACEAHPVSAMCSYNRINGVYGSENKKGNDVLRKEYGFSGAVISDWDAVRDRTKSAKAGLDLEMPFHPEHYEALVADYRAGKISDEEIDACAERILTLVYNCKEMQQGKTRRHTWEDRVAFTQKAEEAGIVLLKNNGVLPIKKGQSLSLCGLFGRPGAYKIKRPDLISGGGSGKVERITPMFDMLEILQREHGSEITYEPAFTENGVDGSFMNPGIAVEQAADSDVNIVFAGTGANIECESVDRATMELNDAAVRTILDTAKVNPNTVVVLFAGAPIDMREWIDVVAAVVYVGFPGEKGGEAIANVLTGKANPSGKLTETFPLAYEDTPAAQAYADSKVTRYEEGMDVGYRYFDTYGKPVLFPFGHGLSYSQFVYSGLKLKTDGNALEVNFEIENRSGIEGKEVSQIYVHAMSSYVYRPYKELKGFAKSYVEAGAKRSVCVKLDLRAFEYWSTAFDQWTIEDGVYEIIVGASATDERLKAKVRIQEGKLVNL